MASDVTQFKLATDAQFALLNTSAYNYTYTLTPMKRWNDDDMKNNQTYNLTFNLNNGTVNTLTYKLTINGPA
jgi:hypothetical protein